jgi:hypothetical protein
MFWLLLLVVWVLVSFLACAVWISLHPGRTPEEEQHDQELEAAHWRANPVEQPRAAEAPSLEKRRPFAP